VYVLGARDVPVADITGTSDPYVRVSLLRIGEQGGAHKKDDARRTRVRSKTLEPVWAQVRLFLFLFLFPYFRMGNSTDAVFLFIQRVLRLRVSMTEWTWT
jgi:hypothetical protein